jgi:hypothetical protein
MTQGNAGGPDTLAANVPVQKSISFKTTLVLLILFPYSLSWLSKLYLVLSTTLD